MILNISRLRASNTDHELLTASISIFYFRRYISRRALADRDLFKLRHIRYDCLFLMYLVDAFSDSSEVKLSTNN